MFVYKKSVFTILGLVLCLIACQSTLAQTTEFTYQGSLNVGTPPGTPANTPHDFEFRLFSAESGGSQLGNILSRPGVTVANGVFSVRLDFGNQFQGVARWIEIRVKPLGGPTYTLLAPRQKVSPTPESIFSLNSDNAATLGGVEADQYLTTTDANANYIQNSSNGQTANFNIDGTGTANILNAGTQFNLNGQRIMSSSIGNLFVGPSAGLAGGAGGSNSFFGVRSGENSTGSNNSFFGSFSGFANAGGVNNSFFGSGSGQANTASNNSFFGFLSGNKNSSGVANTFVGSFAGGNNESGAFNAFFGQRAGPAAVSGNLNTFIGSEAGQFSTGGHSNTFIGASSGATNTTGSLNTTLGFGANVAANNLINATAIGIRALAGASNSLVLGSINGVNNCSPPNCDSVNVGIGTTVPASPLHINGNSPNFALTFTNQANTAGRRGYRIAFDNDRLSFQKANDAGAFLENQVTIDQVTGAVSIGQNGVGGNLTVFGQTLVNTITVANGITLNVLGSIGGTQLCRNLSNQIANCSSSLRYKTNIAPFWSGLSVVNQLRPITFDWKVGGTRDVGFGAEDVARIDPLFVTYNERGEIEGVKYDRIGVVLINAVKEQQAEIKMLEEKIRSQEETIREQKLQIDSVRKALCEMNPASKICKP